MEKSKFDITKMSAEDTRNAIISNKMGAVWNMFVELEYAGILNIYKFCEKYLKRTKDWTKAKYESCMYQKKNEAFSIEEYAQLSAGLRDFAALLMKYADEIDNAKDE